MARPFHEVLAELRNGRYSAALTDALEEVVKAVKENGGKGSVSMKLVITAKDDDGALEINMSVSKSTPSPQLGTALMFADEEGALTRNDPRQGEMFSVPRVINGGASS